jgi:shikimate kinase
LLEELSQRTGILVATGGGAVKSARNRKILRRAALVVWIRTTVDQQLARLSHDKTRPLLQTRDREARLHKLAAERDPLYEEVADLVFKSPNRSSKSAAAALSRLIRDEMRNRGREIRHAHR